MADLTTSYFFPMLFNKFAWGLVAKKKTYSMVWIPYHLGGICMGVLVSGQSFLQTITPHFSQSTVLDQIWSLTLSGEYISLNQTWVIFGSAWQIVLFLSFVQSSRVATRIRSTVCTETQPSDCIIPACWNTKGSCRGLKKKGTPELLVSHLLTLFPVLVLWEDRWVIVCENNF